MSAADAEVTDFVDRLTAEYKAKVERVVDDHLTEAYYDDLGGPEAVIRTQFPSQAWREFFIGLYPPSRQIAYIYERGEPYGRDRDIMVGLGKQIRDEVKHANVLSRLAEEFDAECDLAAWEGPSHAAQVDLCRSATEWDGPHKIAAAFQCSSEIVAAVNTRNMADYLEAEYPRIARSLRDITADEGDHVHVGRLIMKRFATPDEFEELEEIARVKYEAVREVFTNL